jgi:hypothetical protein
MTAHDGEEWMRRASGEMFETRGWYFGHDDDAVTICHTKPADGGAMHCGFLSIPRGIIVSIQPNGERNPKLKSGALPVE